MRAKKKKWQELREAAQENDAAKAIAAAASLKLGRKDKYYESCVTAIRYGAGDALAMLLKAGEGFNFSSKKHMLGYMWIDRNYDKENEKNRKLALQLVEEAYASQKPEAVLPVLYKANSVNNILTLGDFLNKDSPKALLGTCLENKSALTFRQCVEKTGLLSTDKLEFILTFAADCENSYGTLVLSLNKTVVGGDLDKTALLLEHKADANFEGAHVLWLAALNRNQPMVDLLLPSVSLETHGAKIITRLRNLKDADAAIIQSIETTMKNTVQKPAAVEAENDGRFQRLSDSVLAEEQELPGGERLTTLFNFSTRQQIVKWGDGPPAVVSFDDLGDNIIKSMREEFDALAEPAPLRAPSTPAEDAARLKRLRNVI